MYKVIDLEFRKLFMCTIYAKYLKKIHFFNLGKTVCNENYLSKRYIF